MADETIIENEKPQPKRSETGKPSTASTNQAKPAAANASGSKPKAGVIAGAAVAGAAAAGAAGVAFGASRPFQAFAKGFGEDESEPTAEEAQAAEAGNAQEAVAASSDSQESEVMFEDMQEADVSSDSLGASSAAGATTRVVGHGLDVATSVDDSMSFSEAFAAARHEVGAGGIFEWHGQTYGTYYENEWNHMSQADKDQYWADVHYTTSHMDDNMAEVQPEIPVEEEQGPYINDEGELVLTPENVIGEGDLDGDGIADIAIVDVDGNEIPDLLLDTTGDGQYDTLAQDVVVVNDEIVLPTGGVTDINGATVIDNCVDLDEDMEFECDDSDYDTTMEDNPDLDLLASNTIDPNIPIDNNMDMGQFV